MKRISKIRYLSLLSIFCLTLGWGNTVQASDPHVKPRIIATTDGEVDDRSSMIRFLVSSCDFDVAGIVQVNSRYQKSGHSRDHWIENQIDAYEFGLTESENS